MNIVKSTIKLSSAQGVASVLNFLAITFFARELGPRILGIYFLFQSINGITKLVSNFGVRSAIEKRISEGQTSSDILASGIVLRLLLLLPFVCAVLVLRGRVNQFIGSDVALLLIISVLIDEMAELLVFVLKGELRVAETAELQVSQQVGRVITSVILVLFGMGVFALIYGAIVGSLLKLVWSIYKTSINLGTISFKQMKDLFSTGKYYFIPNTTSFLYQWFDTLVVGFFLGQAAVGTYEIAWRVAAMLPLFSKALSKSLFPQVSSWKASKDDNKIVSILPESIVGSYLFVIPGFFGILILSKMILEVVFGSEYIYVWPVLIVLAAGKLFDAADAVIRPTLQGVGNARLSTIAVSLSGMTNMILNILLVFYFDLIGAAIATTVASATRIALQYYYLSRTHPFQFPSKRCSWLIFSAALMGLFIESLSLILAANSAIKLSILISAGAIVYFIIVFFSPSLRQLIIDALENVAPPLRSHI